MIKRQNKKGAIGIILFFLVLFTILVIGFIGTIGVTLIDYTSGVVTPIMEDLGVVGGANLSRASESTFGTVDTVVNAFPWLLTFSYVGMLIFSVVFIVSYRYNPHPAFIGLYFFFIILLIFGAILMSNMYQDLLESNDGIIGDGLRSQTTMSYMILHSPWILSIFAIIVGIYIFAGTQGENGGGFGI